MADIAHEVAGDPGQQVQIARLAVAAGQAHEDAQDFRVALGGQDRRSGVERVAVGQAGRLKEAIAYWRDDLLGDVAAGVLQKRNQIIGGMANRAS